MNEEEKEDIKILAENFHFHDASTPKCLEWLETLLCKVCRYKRKFIKNK